MDPLADKYPNISAYAYCDWNPVMLVDPDGRDHWKIGEDGNAVLIDRKGKGIFVNGMNSSDPAKTYKYKLPYRQRFNYNSKLFKNLLK